MANQEEGKKSKKVDEVLNRLDELFSITDGTLCLAWKLNGRLFGESEETKVLKDKDIEEKTGVLDEMIRSIMRITAKSQELRSLIESFESEI